MEKNGGKPGKITETYFKITETYLTHYHLSKGT